MYNPRQAHYVAALVAMLSIASCDKSATDPGAMLPPPSAVSVITLQSGDVALQHELPGRLEASRIAEVRARVSGIVEKRLFTEGADVKAGQSLFQIDAAPYEAVYQSALAQLARAEADFEGADYQAKRYQQLFAGKSVSEFDLVRANAQQKQSQAQVMAARAAVTSAKIDLDYSKVEAPIDGRIGRGLVTEGALVSQSQATPLAIIQQTDPMLVTFSQDSNELLAMYQAQASGKLVSKDKKQPIIVHLLLADGSEYQHPGQLLFSDITVDASTAQVQLRAEIPNPEGVLLPGMFVRVKFEQASYPGAFLIPQQALTRSETGDTVFIVGDDNVMNVRPVKVVGSVNNQWLVNEGLKNGEQLMVDGFQKARPGSQVTPMPWEAAAATGNADQPAADSKVE